jgi:hypothetical protein
MTRFNRIIISLAALGVLFAVPALAADPGVSKSVLGQDDGTSVVVLNVSAKDRDIYGITVSDASASIDDIVAPNGWIALSAGDVVVFRTVDTPIKSGQSVAFRIVTTNSQASLNVTFRDAKSAFGGSKSI